MKKKRIIAASLAAVFMLSAFSGCGKKSEERPEINLSQTAEKVGHVETVDDAWHRTMGLVYGRDMRGIISPDGKHDTGEIYTICRDVNINLNIFEVSKSNSFNENDVDSLNKMGIVDSFGEIIAPYEYIRFDLLFGDRYVKAIKATKKTQFKEDAIVKLDSDALGGKGPKNENAMYVGEWDIYDVKEHKKVEGISGNTNQPVTTKGDFIEYYDSNGNKLFKNAKTGVELPGNTNVFGDGSYELKEGNSNVVYDSNGNMRFSKDYKDFKVSKSLDNCYEMYKGSGTDTVYAIADMKGNIVSAEFNKVVENYGPFIKSDKKLFGFDGTEISKLDGTARVNKNTSFVLTEAKDKTKTLYTEKGEKIFEYKHSNGDLIREDELIFSKKAKDGFNVYCFKDNDFTIFSNSYIGFGLVEQKNDGVLGLVDVFSGEMIINDYKSYECYKMPDDYSGYFIFAQLHDGSYDVYRITLNK